MCASFSSSPKFISCKPRPLAITLSSPNANASKRLALEANTTLQSGLINDTVNTACGGSTFSPASSEIITLPAFTRPTISASLAIKP